MDLPAKNVSKLRRLLPRFAVAILALAVVGFTGVRAALAAADVNLLETGSSLVYPLFNLWMPVYAHAHPNVRITTQSTGSGTGIAQSAAGIAQIGASDAYMSDALVRSRPDTAAATRTRLTKPAWELPALKNRDGDFALPDDATHILRSLKETKQRHARGAKERT